MMKVAVAVLPNGNINAHFGRANKLAIATVEEKQIAGWEEIEVPFASTHGEHNHDHEHDHNHNHEHHQHAPVHRESIKDFLVNHHVNVVLLEHAGPGMQLVQEQTDIKIVVGAQGDAKSAIQALIDQGFTD